MTPAITATVAESNTRIPASAYVLPHKSVVERPQVDPLAQAERIALAAQKSEYASALAARGVTAAYVLALCRKIVNARHAAAEKAEIFTGDSRMAIAETITRRVAEIARAQVVSVINQDSAAIQRAADAAWPHGKSACAEIRREFLLPLDRSLNVAA